MINLYRYTKGLQSKTYLLSILVLSLFASATNYASYTGNFVRSEISLVLRASTDKQSVSYEKATLIAFSKTSLNYSLYQGRIYSIKNNVAYKTQVNNYFALQQKKLYFQATKFTRGDLPPLLLLS